MGRSGSRVMAFSVSGARSEGQAYLLDSTDIQGFWNHGSGSGVMGTTLGVEAIAEFLLAAMETVYFVSNRRIYKEMTQFWSKLFLINFALGELTLDCRILSQRPSLLGLG